MIFITLVDFSLLRGFLFFWKNTGISVVLPVNPVIWIVWSVPNRVFHYVCCWQCLLVDLISETFVKIKKWKGWCKAEESCSDQKTFILPTFEENGSVTSAGWLTFLIEKTNLFSTSGFWKKRQDILDHHQNQKSKIAI